MKKMMYRIVAGMVLTLFIASTASSAISSQSLSDISETAQANYIAVKTEYQKTSVAYDSAKQDWLTARERYRLSKNSEDLSDALEKANTYLLGAKRRLVNHIDKVSSYVEGNQNLENTVKQKILDELSSYSSWLEEQQQSITDATTRAKFSDIATTVRTKWQEIKQATKRMIGQIMNAKIIRLIEKAEIAADKIEKMILKLNEQGEDTEALEAWLEDFYNKIELAKQKYQAAKEKYTEITNLKDADSLIRKAKDYLLEAKRYLKNSYKTLREIVKELKRYRTREIALSGTGTLIAEGDGVALISGDGTIELSGENGTLIVTDNSGDMTITVTGFGEKTELESNKWEYTGSGSATVTGSDIIVEIKGKNIHLTAEGTGTAILTGTGSYTVYKRLSDSSSACVADDWSADGATIAISAEGG